MGKSPDSVICAILLGMSESVDWLSLASSALATFVGLWLLCLAEVIGVVFEDDVGHGLLVYLIINIRPYLPDEKCFCVKDLNK